MEHNCCSICLDTLEINTIQLKNCHHEFHNHCIEEWLQINNSCPSCRDIVERDIKCHYIKYPLFPFYKKQAFISIKNDSVSIKLKHETIDFRLRSIYIIILNNNIVTFNYKKNGKLTNLNVSFVTHNMALSIYNNITQKFNNDYYELLRNRRELVDNGNTTE
jgi:hypothetical protein